jgi:hypothetical protein
MKHVFFSLVFLGLTLTGFAQQKIIGAIVSANGKALSSAHIIDVNSRQATVADALGAFSLSVADTGTVLRISHVGFKPILHRISSIENYCSELVKNVSITLSRESTLLDMVSVAPSDNTVRKGKRGVVLRDFSFVDGNLLLMAEEGIRYLVYCDDSWQEISRLRVDQLGYRLYDDCLGNVHLYGNDSVHQISTENGQIELTFAFSTRDFLEELAHCSASSDSHIFFSSYNKAGQEVYHYGFHRDSKKGTILQRVYDHEGLQDISTYFSSMTLGFRSNQRALPAGSAFACNNSSGPFGCYSSNSRSTVRMLNNPMNFGTQFVGTPANYERSRLLWGGRNVNFPFGRSQDSYFSSVSNRRLELQNALRDTWSPSPRDRGWLDLLSQPTYSPMFNLRDSIFVFDHVLGICYVHDKEGNEVRSFPTEHQNQKGWRNVLIPDENGEGLYAHVKVRNKIYLVNVDLNDGSLTRSAQLKDALYSEQLRVKDGYAFYIKEYRDILKPDELKRQKL